MINVCVMLGKKKKKIEEKEISYSTNQEKSYKGKKLKYALGIYTATPLLKYYIPSKTASGALSVFIYFFFLLTPSLLHLLI